MNRTSKTPIVLALIAIVIAIAAFFGTHSSAPTPTLGGTTNYDQLALNAGLNVTGGTIQSTGSITSSSTVTIGGIYATTSPGSATFAVSELLYSTIASTPTVGAITLTLPASTTLSTAGFLPRAGDRTSISFYNASSTAGATVTLAGGSGSLLTTSTSTKIVYPTDVDTINIVRLPSTDYSFQMVSAK